jgi:dipeptidyl aminopeptidase/acylaminoacyl peptidase
VRLLNLLCVSICCTGPVVIQAAAQELAPLPVEEVLGVHSFAQYSPAAISPDGKSVAYIVVDNRLTATVSAKQRLETGVAGPPSTGDICLTETASGLSRCPTAGKGNNWAPAWSPDGRRLAFLSDRDGSGQAKVWVWDADTRELKKQSDVSVRGTALQWLPDSLALMVTALPEGMTPGEYARRILGPDSIGPESKVPLGSTVLLYRSAPGVEGTAKPAQGSQWSLENYLRDLVLMEVGMGSVRRIDRGHRVATFSISPDGSRVAFTVPTRFAGPSAQQILFDLTIINLKTGQRWTAASDVPLDYDGSSFSWSPDGSRLAFETAVSQGDGACYIVEANGTGQNQPRKVAGPLRQSPQKLAAPLWEASSRHIYFIDGGALWQAAARGGNAGEVSSIPGHKIVQLLAGRENRLWSSAEGGSTIVLCRAHATNQSGFFSLEIATGRSTKLLENGQCFTCSVREEWATAGNGTLAYFAGDAEHDTDLWLADPEFHSRRQLTHLNPQFERYKMGTAQLVEWQDLDGETLRGALLLPAGYAPGKRYPLIVNVYGGALHSNRIDFFGLGYSGIDNMQLFATRGYSVLLPDAPQRLGTPMLDLAKTVLPGINKIIEMGIADPQRLGIMGHSYGGYSTLSLIVQTTRFKAAVVSAGSSDLVAEYAAMGKDGSTYGLPILELGQGLMGGTPWQFRDRYAENSPIFYLDRAVTPVLILHGSDDSAVPSFLGDEIFVSLRRLGKKVEYAKYQGEGHSPIYWSYENQLDYCTRLIMWFDANLKSLPIHPNLPSN